jgi:hypothetical protein
MKMENIIGGVSPLKARQATRGGKYAKSATATSRRRGGFAASKGVRGGGGRNVGGYNVQTSFKPGAAWVKPTSGTFKPYSFDSDGEVVVNPLEGYDYKKDPDVTTSTRKSGGTFDEVWKRNDKNFQDKWKAYDVDGDGGFEAWKKQAQKEIDAGYYDTKTVDGQKWRRPYIQKDADSDKVYTSDWEKY